MDFPPNTTFYSMHRPDRYTRYRFSLAARTQLGIGEFTVEDSPLFTTEGEAGHIIDGDRAILNKTSEKAWNFRDSLPSQL